MPTRQEITEEVEDSEGMAPRMPEELRRDEQMRKDRERKERGECQWLLRVCVGACLPK